MKNYSIPLIGAPETKWGEAIFKRIMIRKNFQKWCKIGIFRLKGTADPQIRVHKFYAG